MSETEQPATTASNEIASAPSDVTATPQTTSDDSGKKAGLRAVGIIGIATILSRILGLARDMVFAGLFSKTATDAFAIAFTIPNILRRLLAEGIISTAFIPVFSSIEKEDEDTRNNTYGAVLGTFLLVLVVVTIGGVLLSPWLTRLFAPGFKGAKLELTIFLTGLMFPFLFLVGLASFWIAILHTKKHFTAPALGPVTLNIGIIGCALGLAHFFPGNRAITAMAIGVLIGGSLQLVLQVITLTKMGQRVRPRWEPSHPAIKEISLLMAPTLLGMGVYQVNMMVSRQLGSLLPSGSITYLYLSDRLMELPLGVIAVAFATVNLPTLSRQADDENWDDFRDTLVSGLRNVMFFCIPAAFGLFALREPVIATLFERGRFTYTDVLNCSHVVIPAAFGLIFVAALRNLSPGFYAFKDTKTPVKIAAFSLVTNIALSGLFAFLLGMQAQGLTLANACSALLSVALSLYLLDKRLTFHTEEWSQLTFLIPRLLVSGAIMGTVLWFASSWLPWKSMSIFLRLPSLGALVVAGASIYFFLTWQLKLKETELFVGKLKRITRKL